MAKKIHIVVVYWGEHDDTRFYFSSKKKAVEWMKERRKMLLQHNPMSKWCYYTDAEVNPTI